MADHVQDQILDAVKAALLAASTAAGSNVYIERVDPISTAKCPALLIEAGDEDIPPPTSIGWPRVQNRAFRFEIRCTVAVNTGFRKASSALAAQVEKTLCASLSAEQLGGVARNGVHLTGSSVEREGEGDKALYCIVQRWVAGYTTRANAPDVPL